MLPRLRFSLRTLLLAVLSLASLATLWWNWGPWRVAFIVSEPQKIQSVTLSDDDRFLLITYGENDGKSNQLVDVRRLPGGERHAEFDLIWAGSIQSIGRYFVLSGWNKSIKNDQVGWDLLDAESLQSLGHEDLLRNSQSHQFCTFYPNHAIRQSIPNKTIEIYKLHDFKPVATIDNITRMYGQSNSIDHIAYRRNEHLEILNLETGQAIQTENFEDGLTGVNFTPTTMVPYVLSFGGTSMHYIVSLANGKLLMQTDDYNGTCQFTQDGSRYVTLIDNHIELRDVLTGKTLATLFPPASQSSIVGEFSPDGTLWNDPLTHHIRDGHTLTAIWQAPETATKFSLNSDYLVLDYSPRIYNARNGDFLMDIASLRWRGSDLSPNSEQYGTINFAHHSGDFWTTRRDKNQLTYFHMTRPPTWLSILSKPELWLAIVLCSAFIWSIRRGAS